MEIKEPRLVTEKKLIAGLLRHESKEVIDKYAFSLNGKKVEPMAVVFPETETEILNLLKAANETGLPIHFLSTGKNWGYGSAQGTAGQQLIADLSRMNKIDELDEMLGTVRIQPGVTQGQLCSFLQKSNSRLQADVTGAGPDTSIIGNTVERGYGHSDYYDRFANIISMRVILPNGRIMETGFGAYKNARAKRSFRNGIGPIIDGLFSQSNFGIITSITIKLQPRPEYFSMLVMACPKEDDLFPLVDLFREFQLKGVLTGFVQIANLKRAVGDMKVKGLGSWGVCVALSGPKKIVKAREQIIKATIRKKMPPCRVVFLNDWKIRLATWFSKTIYPLSFVENLAYIIDLKKGVPSNKPLEILLNQKEVTTNLNPQDMQQHFRWMCATSPATPEDVSLMYSIAVDCFKKAGFELGVTFSFANPRTVLMIASLNYDKTSEAIFLADELYRNCRTMLLENGFYPYRSGSGMFDELAGKRNLHHSALLGALKNWVDPNGILSPGKYRIQE